MLPSATVYLCDNCRNIVNFGEDSTVPHLERSPSAMALSQLERASFYNFAPVGTYCQTCPTGDLATSFIEIYN